MRRALYDRRSCDVRKVRCGQGTGNNYCHNCGKPLYQRIPVAVWSAGIAAMMVIALGLGLIFYSENQAGGSGEWSCYEGSYVEVGGKRISDVKQIMPCIIETLEEAERVEKLAQERVEEICRSEKEIEEKELLVSDSLNEIPK